MEAADNCCLQQMVRIGRNSLIPSVRISASESSIRMGLFLILVPKEVMGLLAVCCKAPGGVLLWVVADITWVLLGIEGILEYSLSLISFVPTAVNILP